MEMEIEQESLQTTSGSTTSGSSSARTGTSLKAPFSKNKVSSSIKTHGRNFSLSRSSKKHTRETGTIGSYSEERDKREEEDRQPETPAHHQSSFQSMETPFDGNEGRRQKETLSRRSTNLTTKGYDDPDLEWVSDGSGCDAEHDAQDELPKQSLLQNNVCQEALRADKTTGITLDNENGKGQQLKQRIKNAYIDILFGAEYMAKHNLHSPSRNQQSNPASPGAPHINAPLSNPSHESHRSAATREARQKTKTLSALSPPCKSDNSSSPQPQRKHAVHRSKGHGVVPLGTPYLSYTTSDVPLERGNHDELSSLGMTLSKLALGVYVYSVDPTSEAAIAGVLPGSILLRINGMPVVGDPSHITLERLYTYQGWFGTPAQKERPIGLDLVYASKVYRILLLLSSSHDWGIGWASCGNFPLIQKVAPGGIAASFGVQKGALLSGVEIYNESESPSIIKRDKTEPEEIEKEDGPIGVQTSSTAILTTRKTFRRCDHLAIAMQIKKACQQRKELDSSVSPRSTTQEQPHMILSFVFAPKGSRTFEWSKHKPEKEQNKSSSDTAKYEYFSVMTQQEFDEQQRGTQPKVLKTPDCVSTCNRMFFGPSPSPEALPTRVMPDAHSSSRAKEVLSPSLVASLVLAGKIIPPKTQSDLDLFALQYKEEQTEDQRKQHSIRKFDPCPSLSWDASPSLVLTYWNVIADLHHLVSYHALGHNEDALAMEYAIFHQQASDPSPPQDDVSRNSNTICPSSQQNKFLKEIVFYLCNSECGYPNSEKQIVNDGAQVCENILLQLLDVIVRYGSMGEGTKLNSSHHQNVHLMEENNLAALDQVLWAKEIVRALSDALIFQVS
jgi:hypothetical protein